MSLTDVLAKLPDFKSDEIIKSFIKGYSIINNPMYKNPICSISGGSDSDIMLDLIYRIDEQKKVTYVWFDTGLEYKATKAHLEYLENRYGITIRREKAIKTIPLCTKEFGQPFLNKRISEYLDRLIRNDFLFKDGTFEELYKEYPNCKAALKWWCCEWGDGSKFNIDYNLYLKDFLISNPPQFKISAKCCEYAKKKVIHSVIRKFEFDLNIFGVRKAEGGARATAYKNCYTQGDDQYRPLFWFKDEDKREYERAFNIKHSDCYEKWGLLRTGCVGCPYGRNLANELNIVRLFEPNIYRAANNIFKESYEYTKLYRQFVKEMKDKKSGKRRLF